MKSLVISHAKCNDGLTSAYILQYHHKLSGLHEDIKEEDIYMMSHSGYLYKDLEEKGFFKNLKTADNLYVLDYCLNKEVLFKIVKEYPNLTVIEIDHHKTALERDQETMDLISQLDKRGRYIDIIDTRMSGAVLTYIWMFKPTLLDDLEDIQDEEQLHRLIDLHVPDWLLYIQDRDLWLWRYKSRSEPFCYIFMNNIRDIKDFEKYPFILSTQTQELTNAFIEQGKNCLGILNKQVNELANNAFKIKYVLDGFEYIGEAVNVNQYFTSDIGNLISHKDGNNFALMFEYNGKCWKCGLRSRKGVDVSKIAAKFGGGGHAQASGFSWYKNIDELLTHFKE